MAPARRTIGSGRVIGATKPSAKAPAREPVPALDKSSNLLSPSDSTVSLPSQASSSTPPATSFEQHDISSAATRETPVSNSVSERLFCPICSEEMHTLLQLNRHLDSEHQDLEHEEQDEVQTWFKARVSKAKKFQPLVALNQRLKGLDVFESNEDHRPVTQSPRLQASSANGRGTPEPVRQDPDDLITKEHWQRFTKDGLCSDPLCDHRLGGANGSVNCRSCGKLFCEEHSMYQIKLSRSAQWEPVRGSWHRVCETCYKSREGYNDYTGFERDHLKNFSSMRRKAVDKSYLEMSRLEKRLTKLTNLLSDPTIHEESGLVGYFRSLSSFSAGTVSRRREIEQSIVDWEDDISVSHCPFCIQEFSNYTFKRHHCRLCGRVVCGDPATQCSTEVPLNVAAETQNGESEKNPPQQQQQLALDVRMCQNCKRTVFSKSDFERQLAEDPSDQRAFRNLKEFEKGIRASLPRFQKLLTALQNPENPPSEVQLNEAARVRKRLTDSFNQYMMAARRIRDLPTTSPTQKRLQAQIHSQGSQFLHVHMLTLKAVPKMLKHASPHKISQAEQHTSRANGHLSPLAANSRSKSEHSKHSPSASHDSFNTLSSLEDEEKSLRERLMVLEEQKVMVTEMLADARRRRKVEEVESLNRNLEDLNQECSSVQGMLEGVNNSFEGLYLGDGSTNASIGKR